jgi:hypothetical protein
MSVKLDSILWYDANASEQLSCQSGVMLYVMEYIKKLVRPTVQRFDFRVSTGLSFHFVEYNGSYYNVSGIHDYYFISKHDYTILVSRKDSCSSSSSIVRMLSDKDFWVLPYSELNQEARNLFLKIKELIDLSENLYSYLCRIVNLFKNQNPKEMHYRIRQLNFQPVIPFNLPYASETFSEQLTQQEIEKFNTHKKFFFTSSEENKLAQEMLIYQLI